MRLMAPSSESLDQMVPISLSILIPGQTLGMRLYLPSSDRDQRGAPSQYSLYKSGTVEFLERDRVRLLNAGRENVYIQRSEYDAYRDYIKRNLKQIVTNDSIRVDTRIATVAEVGRDVLTHCRHKTDEILRSAKEVSLNIVPLIQRDDFLVGQLHNVLHHDYETFTHSTNVAIFSALIAKGLGVTDECELEQIFVGGLIHDIGKLEICQSILTKPAKLTDYEYDVIKEHPRCGFLKLNQRDDLSWPQLMMVYQHHERMDGMGYPVGCSGEEIDFWARICSVADVFEALTANRPYRTSLSRNKALEIMERSSGHWI